MGVFCEQLQPKMVFKICEGILCPSFSVKELYVIVIHPKAIVYVVKISKRAKDLTTNIQFYVHVGIRNVLKAKIHNDDKF